MQAPEHVIENEQAAKKVAGDPRRTRKLVKSKPPKGIVAWDEAVFDRLVASPPEPLVSHLRVSHATAAQRARPPRRRLRRACDVC